jgi:hypothetical protein
MKLTLSVCAALALIVAMICVAPVIGQEPARGAKGEDAKSTDFTPATKDPNGILKKMEGTFDLDFAMMTEKGEEKYKFPMTYSWALDGQFLTSSYEMKEGAYPHKGIEYFSYNESTGEYESIRLQSMGGAMIVFKGKYDAEKKVLEVKAEFGGEWQGNKFTCNSRTVYTWASDDKYTCEVFSTYKGIPGFEDEIKEVWITCTRAKK